MRAPLRLVASLALAIPAGSVGLSCTPAPAPPPPVVETPPAPAPPGTGTPRPPPAPPGPGAGHLPVGEPGAAPGATPDVIVGTDVCQTDADCMPAQCCHATACVGKAKAPSCADAMCTRECRGGSIDCGGGCLCQQGRCAARVMR